METIDARVTVRADIRPALPPSLVFADLQVLYPVVIVQALLALYEEYNQMFARLVEANREWASDYPHCFEFGNSPVNWAVQIDMVGLNAEFLKEASRMSYEMVHEILRKQIFEIENSLALYNLLDRICDRSNGESSYYSKMIRRLLDGIREQLGKPIALLAVTNEKYQAMRMIEFNKSEGEALSPAEVRTVSGFDALWGPTEFLRHLKSNHGDCTHALYVRASDPVEAMKKPGTLVEHPLLDDLRFRQIIKMNSLTLNVDIPGLAVGDSRRINDTKEYLPPMGMAFRVAEEADLYTQALAVYLEPGKPYGQFSGVERLSRAFMKYLVSVNIDPEKVANGTRMLRAKPAGGTYGCYGHERGTINEQDFRRRVRRGIKQRGPYLLQPEHPAPTILNTADGKEYAYIDRVFLGMITGTPTFLGGFREFLPAESEEAKKGRLHGNRDTVFSEIVPE